MQHLITLVCDDIRTEVGNKVSIMGIYDEAMLVASLPAILPRLSLFQRWSEVADAKSVRVEFKGSALDERHNIEGELEGGSEGARKTKLQMLLSLAPLRIAREGELEIATFFDGGSRPAYVHSISIRQGSVS